MWRADLVRTRTGQMGARLPIAAPGSGPSDETNGIPSGKIEVSRERTASIADAWWEPWRNAIVLGHRHRETDPWVAIMGGPIVALPELGDATNTLSFAGIQEIFKRRALTHEWAGYRDPEKWKRGTQWWDWPLGQVAWEVVQSAQMKPRGGLPIVHGTPEEKIAGAVPGGRYFPNWDLGNARVWDQVLLDLAHEQGGPDLRFTPRYTGRRVEWVMEHGTHHDPRIAHSYTLRLDAAAARPRVSDVKITLSGREAAHRVFGTGAGEGAGTWIRVAEDFSLTEDEMPLLELVVSDTSASSAEEVMALASGRVSGSGLGTWQIQCKVHTSPSLPLWQVRPGAPVQIRVPGRRPFPEGWHRGRVLKATYSLTSDVVQVEIEQEGTG